MIKWPSRTPHIEVSFSFESEQRLHVNANQNTQQSVKHHDHHYPLHPLQPSPHSLAPQNQAPAVSQTYTSLPDILVDRVIELQVHVIKGIHITSADFELDTRARCLELESDKIDLCPANKAETS